MAAAAASGEPNEPFLGRKGKDEGLGAGLALDVVVREGLETEQVRIVRVGGEARERGPAGDATIRMDDLVVGRTELVADTRGRGDGEGAKCGGGRGGVGAAGVALVRREVGHGRLPAAREFFF